VARLRQGLDRQDGPTVVAAHSYGGQIMTALRTDAPNVVALVYIAAFGLDEGIDRRVAGRGTSHSGTGTSGHRQAGLRLAARGRLREPLRGRRRPGPGPGHVRRAAARGGIRLPGRDGGAGLESLPSWFLVAEGDQAIPPGAERQFAQRMGVTKVEVATNHVAMVSHPDDVVQLIETAAKAVQAAA
jgi:pimeloyl-ACP methyl ester carboxylesterase